MSSVGVSIYADTAQMKTLALALKLAPKEVRKGALVALRTEMKIIMADASTRASFSSRITSSMKITGSGLRLKGVAGGGSAYIAVPIENRGAGFVTHPTFGHAPDTNKNSHAAFMTPALDAHREEAIEVLTVAVYAEVLKSLRV